MLLSLATATAHLGVFVAVIAIGFLVGIVGQLGRSRTLVMTGIILIAGVTLYFLIVGENHANCQGTCL